MKPYSNELMEVFGRFKDVLRQYAAQSAAEQLCIMVEGLMDIAYTEGKMESTLEFKDICNKAVKAGNDEPQA